MHLLEQIPAYASTETLIMISMDKYQKYNNNKKKKNKKNLKKKIIMNMMIHDEEEEQEEGRGRREGR